MTHLTRVLWPGLCFVVITCFTAFALDRASVVGDFLPKNGEILEGQVSGIVRDTNGSPIAGAIVSFNPGHFPRELPYSETKSDELGRYSMKLHREISGQQGWDSPMYPTHFIMARYLEKNLAAFRVFESFPTNLDLILETGLSLSGTVVDTNGLPMKNATADLMIGLGGHNSKLGPNPITTDSFGKFFVPALPQGHSYFFSKGFTVRGLRCKWRRSLGKGFFYESPCVPTFCS